MNKLDELTLKHNEHFNAIRNKAFKYLETYEKSSFCMSVPEYICERFSSEPNEENLTYDVSHNSVKIIYPDNHFFHEVYLSSSNLTKRGTTFLPEIVIFKKEINNKKVLYSFYDCDEIEIEISLKNSFKSLIVISNDYPVSLRYSNSSNKNYIFTNEEQELINQLKFLKKLLSLNKNTTLDFLLGDKKISLDEKESFELINDCSFSTIEDLIFDKLLVKNNNTKKEILK